MMNKSSKATYRCALKSYFTLLEIDSDNYFQSDRNYQKDVETYLIKISENNRPPKTVRTYLAAVKLFLLENDVDISYKFWRKIKGRVNGNKARTMDEVPKDSLTIRKIFSHMDLKGRALYLTLASSGMRLGESLQITLNDLELDEEPVRINIRGEYTKNGDPRVTFISSEAKETMIEWLNQRKSWLKSAEKKANGISAAKNLGITKKIDDDRIFPFSNNIAEVIWVNALKKAGLAKRDPSTKRLTLHPHTLRKWFRTRLGKINVDYTETIMGHAGYLTDAYRRYGVEEVAKWYLENQQNLYIFTDASELARLKSDVQKDIEAQRKMIEELVLEKSLLKTQVDGLAKRINRYEAFNKKFVSYSPERIKRLFEIIENEEYQEFKETMNQPIELAKNNANDD